MGSTTCSENSLVSVGMATGGGNCETDAETSSDPQFLLQQLREARVEKERSLAKYEQVSVHICGYHEIDGWMDEWMNE